MLIFILQTIGGTGDYKETGGGVIHIISLAHEWSKLGNEVHFITNSADKTSYDNSSPVVIHKVPSYGRSFVIDMYMNFFIQKREIESIVRSTIRLSQKDSIILAASAYPSDVLATFSISRELGIKSAVYFHHLSPSLLFHPFRRGGLFRTGYNWLINQLALLFVKLGGILPCIDYPNAFAKAGWTFKTGYLESRQFLPKDEDHLVETGSRELEACFIGRIAKYKGVIDLLKAWKLVTHSIPGAKLVISGKSSEGKFTNELIRLRRKLKLEQNVVFTLHFITNKEKSSLLSNSRLFVFPSYEEGWSLGVMEAVLHGALPVTYDLPAYDYLGPTASKVKAGDIRSLARECVYMLQREAIRHNRVKNMAECISGLESHEIAKSQYANFESFIEHGRV